MLSEEKNKVLFDPGFSQFSVDFPSEAFEYLDQIAKLKQNHQKKFAFTKLETQIVPIIRHYASFYLGCILWGIYLSEKYKDDAREITGNPILSMTEEEKSKINYDNEIDFILNFSQKLESSSKFYLNRPSKIQSELLKYIELYKDFANINDNFKNLVYTNDIKIPQIALTIINCNENSVDMLKSKIEEAIDARNLELLLACGYLIAD